MAIRSGRPGYLLGGKTNSSYVPDEALVESTRPIACVVEGTTRRHPGNPHLFRCRG